MATPAQYEAATKALLTFTYNLVNAKVPTMFQNEAKEHALQFCTDAAKVAVDAAEAVK